MIEFVCLDCAGRFELAELPDACPTCGAMATVVDLTKTVGLASDTLRDDGHTPPGYEFLAELGRGGMGVVYQARQVALNRVVALKMMLSGAHAGPAEMSRFRTEAEALARVCHPGIVDVHEIGEHDGQLFLSMEFCAGGSLEKKLRGTPLKPAEAATLVRQIAEAMHAAHAVKIIHRDLKPANVLLANDGTPKVTDFGLAKKLDEQGQTQTGAVMGTPSYMAPEQAQGRKVGPAADIYSLGAILYECLTGRPPFRAATILETLSQVINQEPVAVRQLNPAVPRDLEVICLKCLRKEPEKRYATAHELADDLRRYQTGEPIQARPVGLVERSVKWVRRNPTQASLALGGLLIVVVGVVAGLVYQRQLEANRARLMVDSLRTATPVEVLRIRADLLALRSHTEPAVRELLAASHGNLGDSRAELNAALVLLQWDSVELDFVLERLLVAPPDDLITCRELLQPQEELVKMRLEPIVVDRSAARARRLRAQAIVAAEGSSVPPEFADDLVGQMLVEDRLNLSGWVRALRPVRASLIDALIRRYSQRGDDEAGVGAALILREYLTGDLGRVLPLIDRGGVRQAYLVAAALRGSPQAEQPLLQEWNRIVLEAPKHLDLFNPDEPYDVDARRRTRFGLALLAIGHAEPVWQACARSDDPRLRTYLIHAFAEARVDPRLLQGALASEGNPSIRQAVYLAWGDFTLDLWSTAEFEALTRQLVADYELHPDPGVHSAAAWLLRQWKQAERLEGVASRLPRETARGERRWFTNAQGMTFAVIPGPSEIVLGSYWHESGWASSEPFYGPERKHRRRIDRTYALATHEITFDLTERFRRECGAHLPLKKLFGMSWSSQTDDSPAVNMTWYEAALFCRWLSEKEGVPEAQQCYPPLKEIKPGMTMPADYLQRTGYRLPTEAEWEHACRAGSRTPYEFGSDQELLGRYGWFERVSRKRTHPVGLLRPNSFGLFDTYGNGFEWCGVRAEAYPDIDSIQPILADRGGEAVCNPDDLCVLRGGDFVSVPERLRSAHRTIVKRSFDWPASGLRVARTITAPALDVYRVEIDGSRCRFDVRGKPGRFRVTNATDGIALEPTQGDIPGSIEGTNLDRVRRPFSFSVERVDSEEKVRVTDAFLPISWAVRWYAWEPNPIRVDLAPTEEAWSRAVAGKPLHEEKTDRISIAWQDMHPLPGVPQLFCGMVATAEVDLAAGSYQFVTAAHSHGCRVFLDDEWLLEQRWSRRINRQEAVRTLRGGKHTLRVEYYAGGGRASFDFQMRSLPSPTRGAP